MLDISDYRDYKKFLNQKLDELDGSGRGSRSRLARHIGCQTAYIAQVLRGSSHFSLEQGESINDFLGHTDDQGAYFLLLIQYARSSTSKLRKRFEKQIETMKKDIAALKNRLAASPAPSEEDQPTYYSSWVYAAVHALISVPGFQTIDKISERLNISKKRLMKPSIF